MRINLRRFFLTIILPTVLTMGLFILLIFRFIIPYFEQNMVNQKKETIRELISSAISIAHTCQKEVELGSLSDEEAKAAAIRQIGNIRYGIENKDYCWITDTKPLMIHHPYRPDLNGKDLNDFVDPTGKKMFVEMVTAVKQSGSGYVDYQWQWMDDPSRIVPKISFVQAFQPWGWIIGTGIYIEDIRQEIAAIKKKLLGVLLLITILIAMLLTFIVRQNLKAEIKRSNAETDLLDSRERYKALVEASSEGTWMIIEGETLYFNKKLQDLIPGISDIHISPDFHEIIAPDRTEDMDQIRQFASEQTSSLRLETCIEHSGKHKIDVILTISRITLSEKKGYIVIIKELGTITETNALLDAANMLGIGYFRASPGKIGHFLDANPQAVSILGFQASHELLSLQISELVANPKEWLRLLRRLDQAGYIIRFPLQIRTHGENPRTVQVSARMVRDDQGTILGSDVLLEDITEEMSRNRSRESLLNSILNIQINLHQTIEPLVQPPMSCLSSASIHQAAAIMHTHKRDHLLVLDTDLTPCGIVSDGDLVRRVLAQGLDPNQSVRNFMSAPLVAIGHQQSLLAALNLMDQCGLNQLVVKDQHEAVLGTVSRRQAHPFTQQRVSLGTPAAQTDRPEDLKTRFQQLPDLLAPLVNSGCHCHWITAITSDLADHAILTLTGHLENEWGPPPVPYAIISLGSMGRKEPTLLSDQDNALIYQDPPKELADFCRIYFHRFASRLNPMLSEIGYPLCPGEIMAQTARWNQPLSIWKSYFDQWITHPDPQNLIETATFFDLRHVSGDAMLIQDLKSHIALELRRHPSLQNFLARECLQYKIPLGLFGKIQTDGNDPGSNRLNLKNPIRVLVNLARLYAIANGIEESNTLKRMQILRERELLSESLGRGLEFGFDFLMRMQIRSQIHTLEFSQEPNASIDISNLSEIEITTIKAIFSEIGTFQSKLKHDFSISDS